MGIFKKALVITGPLLYLIFAVVGIDKPGVHYDEIFWANASLGIDKSFIFKQFHGFPFMVLPYVGALKSYIYWIIFHIFGVSYLSIRLPSIVLVLVSLYVLYNFLKYFTDKSIATLSIFLLSTDPFFIAITRVDMGPVVIEFLLKIVLLYLLTRYIKTKQNFFVYILFVTFLGIFNKLNFIWIILAYIFSFSLTYGYKIISRFNQVRLKRYSIYLVFLLIAFISYLFKFIGKDNLVNFSGFGFRSHIIWYNFFNTINDSLFYRFVVGYFPLDFLGKVYSFYIIVIILSGWLLSTKDMKVQKKFIFFICIVIAILFQLVLTRQATAPWHIFFIQPFWTILISFSLLLIAKISKVLASVLFAFVFIYQLYVNVLYFKGYSLPLQNIFWSKSIDSLVMYTSRKDNIFVEIDWGIHNQLILFDQAKDKYFEMYAFFNSPMSQVQSKWFDDKFLNNSSTRYILHGRLATQFEESRSNFLKYIADKKYKLVEEVVIKDPDQNSLYEIYRVEKN